jgi:hypothetical protein
VIVAVVSTLGLIAAAAPQAAAPAAPSAVLQLSTGIVEEIRTATDAPRASIGVFVNGPTPELGRALQTAVIGGLAASHFKSVVPVNAATAAEAEAKARELGLDWIARLQAAVLETEFTLAGDLVPTWENFWANRLARAPGGRALSAHATADPEILGLARLPTSKPAARPGARALRAVTQLLVRLPVRVIAMAIGDVDGDGRGELALLTPAQVLLVRPDGTVLAREDFAHLAPAAHPSRGQAGTIVVGRANNTTLVGYWSADRAKAESLTYDEHSLRRVGESETVPVCSGLGGVLAGIPVAGEGLVDHVAHASTAPARFLSEPVLAVAPNAKTAAGPAFLALLPDGSAKLFTAELNPIGVAIPNVGAGSALADLGGDGQLELVATQGSPVTEDRVRVYRIGGTLMPVDLAGDVLQGEVLAGAAGDLDGDGREEVVLAAENGDGTILYRVGAEP